jgi:hypothetical protein
MFFLFLTYFSNKSAKMPRLENGMYIPWYGQES